MSDDATLDEFAEFSESKASNESSLGKRWDMNQANEIMEITRGASPRPKGDPELFGGDIPWIKIGDVDVKSQKYTGETEDTVTEKGAEKSKLVDSGTLLVSNSGTCGYPMFAGTRSCVHDGWLILRDYENDLNPHYLYEYISWQQNYLKSLAPGSTQINLNTSRFGVLEIAIPPLSEQRKIATVLHTVDQAIQKTEEIIEQIRRVKTGIQQELFTEGYYDHNSFVETRVGTLPESWRLEKVKNYTELVSGAHVKSDLVSDDSSLTPYLTGPDDFDELGFTVTKYTDEPTKFCEAGDTLVTVKGSGCGKSTFANQRACISRQLKAIRPSDGLEELYLFYFLETKQTLLENLAEGSAIPGLSNSHLTALDIPVPSTEEQHRISETLKVYDNGIVQEKNYKSQLQRFKKGLLQDLLCGKVRTTNTNIEIPEEVAKYG